MNRLLASLLFAAAGFVPVHAAESCASQSLCTPPAEPGQTAPTSRVLLRADGATAPSIEYRRPDEVVTLGMPDTVEAAPLTREVPVLENRREPLPTVLRSSPPDWTSSGSVSARRWYRSSSACRARRICACASPAMPTSSA